MPGLRENLEGTLKRDITIDEEFAALIPPLTDDEFSRLEQSILLEGCRDPIIIWDGVIIDGHNRFRICTAHNIPFNTQNISFDSRDEAMLWMLQNQLARRNLNDFQRIEIVRKYEHVVKAQAKARQGTRTDLPTSEKNFSNVEHSGRELSGVGQPQKATRATQELGAMAGVSHKTYEHATAIIDNAPVEVLDAVRSQAVSIHAGYQATKLPPEAQADISHRIREGENPRKVVAEAVKRPQRYSISPKRDDVRKALVLSGVHGISLNDMFVKLIHEALGLKRYKQILQGQKKETKE